jgi:type IV secretory pathway VirB6-like protein
MDFKNIIISIAIVFVGVLGILGYIAALNTTYNDGVGNTTFNNTMNQLNRINNITVLSNNFGGDITNNNGNQSTQGSDTSVSELTLAGLKTIKRLPSILGIATSMMQDASVLLGVGETGNILVGLAISVFLIVFVITLMYVIVLGVRKL